MNILVTGSAGFIGYHTSLKLLENKTLKVFGIDNLDDYYSIKIKKDRLKNLIKKSNFHFKLLDINNKKKLKSLFEKNKFTIVIHLAAQPGVTYSMQNPNKYIKSNVMGFFNVLDLSMKYKIKNFIYASSSSVYGKNNNQFNKETDNTDNPLSIYSTTKKTNELMAYTYSNLYNFKTIGLRFFTVYGNYSRPDMFFSKLAYSIKNDKKIKVFNSGELFRDFTFVNDVVNCLIKLIKYNIKKDVPAEVFNIGNSKAIKLTKIIKIFEKHYKKKAKIINSKLSNGELKKTKSSMKKLNKSIKINKFTNIENGLKIFLKWYDSYYF